MQHPWFAGVTPIAQKLDPAEDAVAMKQSQLVPVEAVDKVDHVDTEKEAGLSKRAMQAKAILEHVSGQAMGTAWKAWTALHP